MGPFDLVLGLFDDSAALTRLQAKVEQGELTGIFCVDNPLDPSCIYPCGVDGYLGSDGICHFIANGQAYPPQGGPQGPQYEPNPAQDGVNSTYTSSGATNVVVNNTVNIANEGIDRITNAVMKGITDAQANTDELVKRIRDNLEHAIAEEADGIKAGITNANDNLATQIKITTTAVAASAAGTAAVTTKAIADQVDAVKNTITPILTSITDFINKINTEVQKINDTFIEPLVNLYNSTIGEISTLTTAIEKDLKDGIGGLLKIPGQLADTLGSFDAALNRTVQQLGLANKEIIDSSIKTIGTDLPQPFASAFARNFGGSPTASALKTTFGDKIALNPESLSNVSATAIKGIGSLLSEMLTIIVETFKEPFENLHATWTSAGGVFVGLLDGALAILTTITALGAIAAPLIEAAEEEARIKIPIKKLAPATILEAMHRGFVDQVAALKEIQTGGIDSTRQKVLLDLSYFLADYNTALDWWYRGLITDEDLYANIKAHGVTEEDAKTIVASSVNLPSLEGTLKKFNYRLIERDAVILNLRKLRYTDTQIESIFATYQDRESPQTLSQLSGLLNNSNAGWLNASINQPTPPDVDLAGSRAGYHPDLTRYIWLSHWQLPSVEQFIQSYFRGLRTRSEVYERMAIANIPSELHDELIQINQSLIPYRSIPSFVTKGYMTLDQADRELESHGFDLPHRQLILKAAIPKAAPTTAKTVADVHYLSESNARALWADGALTDAQYLEILTHHDYTPELAALKIKADKVSLHIKQQKDTLIDYEAQVQAGGMSLDVAIAELSKQGFTNAQISKFTLKQERALKVNTKIPSWANLVKFYKADLVTLDDVAGALQQLGWGEPWFSAFMGLIAKGEEPADEQS